MARRGASFTKTSALVRTKRTWLFAASIAFGAIGFAPAMIALVGAVLGSFHHYGAWLGFIAYFAGLIGGLDASNRWWKEERGEVAAGETEVRLGDRSLVRRSSVRHGHVLHRGDRVFVRLARMFRHVEIEVADEEQGEALLAAMRLDAARSVAQYPMTHGTWRGSLIRAAAAASPMVLLAPLFLLAGLPIGVFIPVLLASAVASALYSVNQILRVSVGADGVRIRHLLQRPKFVPFSAIEEAITDGRDITLRLVGGEEIVMHYPAGNATERLVLTDRADEGGKLVERIKRQVEAHRASSAADPATFARSGRETERWVRDVVGAKDGNASYRTQAVPPDELWRIVEDAAAPATARAGAAVALRGGLDEEGRVRLRATADACAAPRLRVALETVASGEEDDEGLRGVLEPLEDPPEALRVRRT